MSVTWSPPPSAVWQPAVENYINAILERVDKLIHQFAKDIEEWMKINAPWKDRSSNARQTLRAEAERLGREVWSILLAGGVDYFVYLELAHQGRFAIIGPALNRFVPQIFNDLRKLLS